MDTTSASGFTSMQRKVNYVSGLIRFAFDVEPEWAPQATSDWTAAPGSGQWSVEESAPRAFGDTQV